jgi:hypothetical protein
MSLSSSLVCYDIVFLQFHAISSLIFPNVSFFKSCLLWYCILLFSILLTCCFQLYRFGNFIYIWWFFNSFKMFQFCLWYKSL